MTGDHLTTIKANCHCGEPASTLRRVPGCRCVIARCGGHDKDIDREVREHKHG